MALWRAVKEAVAGDAIVIANAGTNSTRESVAAVTEAQAAGADAILAVVPYYNKPTQSGMLAHFGAIADATSLPVVIYNIPGRTGANMLPETLLELARRHHNVAGVKESSGDLKQIGTILRDERRALVCGRATIICFCRAWRWAPTASSASRRISVRSSTARCSTLIARDASPKPPRLHGSLLPLIDALFATTSPIPVKWAMAQWASTSDRAVCRSTRCPLPSADRLRPLLAPYASQPVETR